jgi:hypothetical protein
VFGVGSNRTMESGQVPEAGAEWWQPLEIVTLNYSTLLSGP